MYVCSSFEVVGCPFLAKQEAHPQSEQNKRPLRERPISIAWPQKSTSAIATSRVGSKGRVCMDGLELTGKEADMRQGH